MPRLSPHRLVAHTLTPALLAIVGCGSGIPSTAAPSTPAAARPIDEAAVSTALGLQGTLLPGGVYRVGMPRTDLHVTIGDVVLKPGFALGSYAAFTPTNSGTVVVGDLALLEIEVPAVTARLQEVGFQETAIHNHLLGETPRVLYLHFKGAGDAARLGASLRQILAVTATPLGRPSSPAPGTQPALDTAAIDQALGRTGKLSGGVYQVGIPRREQIRLDGVSLPPASGATTAINFEPASGGRAAITGDFALLPTEVPDVLRVLRDGGIAITALHSHMLTDSPHLLYCHFFALGDAGALAATLKLAIARTNSGA
jgi:hypothetical protein